MGVEMLPEVEQDVSVQLNPADTPEANPQPSFQPSEIKLDKKEVREAMRQAAMQGIDPFSLAVGDLQKDQTPPPKAEAERPLEVPEKFKKPNGEVDVEKLQASTRQLDEAIQEKEQKIEALKETAPDTGKFVEEALKAYKEKYKQFRALPNPDKLAAQAPVQVPPQQLPPDQLKAKILQDLNADPVGTLTELIDIISEKKLEPVKSEFELTREERRDNEVRGNLKALAEKDVRVVAHIAAINAKLEADPELWKLKNPHKAAWLEVKEDLRLGEVPNGNLAQPSKPATPILGGGTPPPAPASSSEPITQETIFAAASILGKDPRTQKYDPNQRAALNQAAKKFFDDLDRRARRF